MPSIFSFHDDFLTMKVASHSICSSLILNPPSFYEALMILEVFQIVDCLPNAGLSIHVANGTGRRESFLLAYSQRASRFVKRVVWKKLPSFLSKSCCSSQQLQSITTIVHACCVRILQKHTLLKL